MKKNIFFSVFLSFLSVLFAFFVVEVITSFFFVSSIPKYPLDPNVTQIHKTPEYDVKYEINNVGLRGEDYRKNFNYDFILLGDSFLYGMGVPYQESLGGLLGNKGRKILNLSEIATNPIDYAEKLKVSLRDKITAGNYVIGLFIGNDFQDITEADNIAEVLNAETYTSESYLYSILTFDRLRFLGNTAFEKFFKKNNISVYNFKKIKKFSSDWVRWYTGSDQKRMDAMLNKKYEPIKSDADYFSLAQLNGKSIDKTLLILNFMASKISDKAKVWLLIIPDRHFFMGELGTSYNEKIQVLLRGLDKKYNIIDFHKYSDTGCYFTNDGHWNEYGHTKAYQVLSEEAAND